VQRAYRTEQQSKERERERLNFNPTTTRPETLFLPMEALLVITGVAAVIILSVAVFALKKWRK